MLRFLIIYFSIYLLPTKLFGSVLVLSIGSNFSFDKQNKRLEFAEKDAEEFERSMLRVGDILPGQIIVGKDLGLKDFLSKLEESKKKIDAVKNSENRINKLIMFFSGHSDERGLHFKDGFYPRAELSKFLEELVVKTKVVIIDSCYSGLLANKGVKKTSSVNVPKFNFDEPSGTLFLTSTSNSDVSYESKKLQGGIFTRSIIDGLHGKADANQDGVVTANELYEYSYRETRLVSQMIPTQQVQTPEFSSRLNGRGAIALSFPAQGKGDIIFTKELSGLLRLYSIKGLSYYDFLKTKGRDEKITVPTGEYRVQFQQGQSLGLSEIQVRSRSAAILTGADFNWLHQKNLGNEYKLHQE